MEGVRTYTTLLDARLPPCLSVSTTGRGGARIGHGVIYEYWHISSARWKEYTPQQWDAHSTTISGTGNSSSATSVLL